MTVTASEISHLSAEELAGLQHVGYGDESRSAATCILVDQAIRHITGHDDAVEILPLAEALTRYDWVQDLMFGLIAPDEDERLREATESRHAPLGHFLRVRKGAKVTLPVQLFTLMDVPQEWQFVHDITVIEDGAEVDIISGNATPAAVHAGHHLSLSETYLGEGAVCRSVSIEHWGRSMDVCSYARTHVGPNARCIASQIQMAPLKRHEAQSRTYVEAGGMANDQTVVFAPKGSERIMDSETVLKGEGAAAESVTQMVTDGGTIRNTARLIADAGQTRGFLGCNGLKLTDEGEILSVPSLLARRSDAQLSHEASIGMIDREKLAYLMASGMSEDAARDLIIQGFLSLEDDNIPASVRDDVKRLVAQAHSGAM